MTKYFVVLNGEWYDSPASQNLVLKRIKELSPTEMEKYKVPHDGFKNFNEFFSRELKDGE